MTIAAADTPVIRSITVPPGWGATGRLVVVPARDEAERIGACLESIAPQGADVVVVANNCVDATTAAAIAGGAAVVDCLIPAGGVGAARRLGMDKGLGLMPGAGAFLTTDADCVVAPDWIATNVGLIAAGAGAVCGFVLPIPEEHAALPAALLRRAALEDRFYELKAELEERLAGHAGHVQTPGASLCFHPAAYAAAGGFDPIRTAEDRAIINRLKALGFAVVHARNAVVRASCRMVGRAPGGMAAALRDRAANPEAPLCPDMRLSNEPRAAAILGGLGPLRDPSDLPEAIRRLEGFVARIPPPSASPFACRAAYAPETPRGSMPWMRRA